MALDRKSLLRFGEKAVKVGSDLAEVIVHVKERPSLLTAVSIASRVMNSALDVVQRDQGKFFKGWTSVDNLASLSSFSHSLCKRCQLLEEVDKDEESKKGTPVVADVFGVRIGWMEYKGWNEGPWTDRKKKTEASDAIGRLIWETYGNCTKLHQPLIGSLEVVRDPMIEVLPSKTAEELHARIDKFLQNGYGRSVLLYGKPGTGKSHVIRDVSRRAGGFSLRVKAGEMENIRGIANIVSVLKPSAVLIDDFDRIERPEAILDELEEARTSASILLATANVIDDMDPAVLRPGRFDIVMEMLQVDNEVVDKLIGGQLPSDVEKKLRDLPIAYIDEFNRIRKTMGVDQAISELDDLVSRAKLVDGLISEGKSGSRLARRKTRKIHWSGEGREKTG